MLQCQDCGRTDEEVEVTEGFCPYMEDIYGEQVPVTLCKDCYWERCQDI